MFLFVVFTVDLRGFSHLPKQIVHHYTHLVFVYNFANL